MARAGLALACLGVLFAAVSCAGVEYRGRVFDNGVARYRVGALGPGFERVRVGDNDLAFHDPRIGTISVNSTCKNYEDVPPVALMNELLFGTTGREYRVEETVTLDGRGARHVVADVQLDGVPVRIDIYLVQKDGCVFDLSYIAARNVFERGQPVFEAFVRGFSVLRTPLRAS